DRLAPRRPLRVLVEVGVPGGRAGARTLDDALAVAEAVAASPHLELCGVAGFEGIISPADGPVAPRVDAFLNLIVEVAATASERGLFQGPEVILTAGGSTYFDRVVERLTAANLGRPTRVVIRSGCYLTHDDGGYARSSPLGDEPRIDGYG